MRHTIRALVIVSPVTTRIRQIPTEVPLGPDDGLPRVCVTNLDTIVTIQKASLKEFITALNFQKIQAVDAALHFVLGLKE